MLIIRLLENKSVREKYIAKAILGLVTATTCLPGYANQDSEIIEQRFKELSDY
ncbi:hypothetical protein KAM622c_11410 [Klebsiella quasipneumoniae subsp. quasipneumoniae]|nr:hypothetical protein KAM622c_11410 [Klebsiella quasipneumoniae subsp. quasipneumoniae]